MTQQIKALATKADDQNSTSWTRVAGTKTDSHGLRSDFYLCSKAITYPHLNMVVYIFLIVYIYIYITGSV